MTQGYSGTPLPKKLGIDRDVLLLGEPLDFDPVTLGSGVDITRGADPSRRWAVVLLFCPDAATLASWFEAAKAHQTPNGAVWVCWPKKSSRVKTDLTEDAVREFGLANGRVDVKVAAIDATWSGLKFVVRLTDR